MIRALLLLLLAAPAWAGQGMGPGPGLGRGGGGGGGGGVFTSSDFTASNALPLSSYTGAIGGTWTRHPATSATTAQIYNNRACATGDSANTVVYYASGVPAGAEYAVDADMTYLGGVTSAQAGIYARLDTTNHTGYLVRYDQTSGEWQLRKVVAGTFTTLGTYAQAISTGVAYHIRFEARNTSKRVLIDGVERIVDTTDNEVTAAGRAGIRLYRSNFTEGHHLDNVVGTNL